MERKLKKKKLNIEHQENDSLTASEREQIKQLFCKKFVYSTNAKWSLKSTSAFGQFAKDFLSKQDSEFCRHEEHNSADEDSRTNEAKHSSVSAAQNVDSCSLSNARHAFPCESLDSAETWPGNVPSGQRSESSSNVYQSVLAGFAQGKDKVSHNAKTARRKVCPLHRRHVKKVKIALPAPWQHDALVAEKDRLNTLKDRLSDKEMVAWHQHTNSTNLAGKVVGEIKSNYYAELCTQAWCKFHEIMACQDVLPAAVLCQPHSRLNSIHLCEAPGAFITSLNHYLVSRGFDTHNKWQWLGTTLNPYYEGNDTGRMISDDRFIRTTFDNWFFGRDDSGDLMTEDNMLALMERAELMGDIHLITADGSIDCQENPAEQEVIVSRLHHCEVLSSCLLLAPGGTLVIKLFTMLEASSIALLYFLNCAFEKVTVCKPATSKSGNSEVYAVCSGYSAPLSHDALFSVFSAVCASDDPHIVLLTKEDIPDEFLAEHQKCCLYFSKLQSDTISRNLALYGTMEESQKKRLAFLQSECAKHYVALCAVQGIDDGDRIRPYSYKSNFSRFLNHRPNQDRFNKSPRSNNQHALNGIGSGSVSLPLGRLQGTFQQRQQQNQFPWQQLLTQIPDYPVNEGGCMMIKCRHELAEEELREWTVQMGRPIDVVASSHFCDPRMLGDVQLMLQHAQMKLHQQKVLAQHSVTTLSEAFQLLHTTSLFNSHHHRHHSHNPITALYHLALEGSVTSFWPHGSAELSQRFHHRRLSCVEDLNELGEGVVGVVVDITRPLWLGEEEVRCQTRLLEVMMNVFSYIDRGSTVVVILPLALARLTAGLLYIFAGLFQETSCAGKGESMYLHQTLCFHNLSYPTYTLLRLLETLRHAFASPQPPTPSLPCPDAAPQKDLDNDTCMAEDADCDNHTGHESSGVACHENISDDVSLRPGSGGVKGCGSARNVIGRSQTVMAAGGCDVSCHGGFGSSERKDGASKHEAHGNDESGNARIAETAVSGVSDRRTADIGSHLHCHHSSVERDSAENADSDRRMSHEDDSVPSDCQVHNPAPSDTVSDRKMSHDGDTDTMPSQNDTKRTLSVDVQMSNHGDPEKCDKFPSADTKEIKRTVSAEGESNSSHENTEKQAANFANGATSAESKTHLTCAKDCSAMHLKNVKGVMPVTDVTSSTQFSFDSHSCSCGSSLHSIASHAHQSQVEGSSAKSSLRTKRTRDLSDDTNGPLGRVLHHHQSMPTSPGQQREGGMTKHCGGCEENAGVGTCVEVPLGVVPILEIVNDATFTRFLQASNRRSMCSFLRTVKAAEQKLLASQPPSTS